jgi:hypothetical protein
MGKKKSKSQETENIAELQQSLEEKTDEIQALNQKILTLQNKEEPLANLPFYSCCESTRKAIEMKITEMANVQTSAKTWREFIATILTGHDPDMPIMTTFPLIDLMKVPFTVENAKIFFAFCCMLHDIMTMMRA